MPTVRASDLRRMHAPASVGFRCPKCVTGARVRQPRTAFGAALKPGGGSMTKIIMVVLAVVYVLDLVSRGCSPPLIMANDFVAMGQFWRLLTSALLSGTLIGLLMNLLVLWIAGRAIESELGGWRFAALYLGRGSADRRCSSCWGPGAQP